MKLTKSIGKNLKLLFRSKETAYTIIFGPILIILLVSFAFKGADDSYKINIGTYAPTATDYSERTISSLGQKGYAVAQYTTLDECIQSVKGGTTNVCIAFSDREAGNGTAPVTLYLDSSRTNLVYQIADDLSAALELQTNVIRQQMTADTLTRLQTAAQSLDKDINTTRKLEENLNVVAKELTSSALALNNITNTTFNETEIQALKGYQLGLASYTRASVNISLTIIDESEQMILRLSDKCNCSDETIKSAADASKDLDNAKSDLLDLSEVKSRQLLDNANLQLEDALYEARIVNAKLSNDSSARELIKLHIRNAQSVAVQDSGIVTSTRLGMEGTNEILTGQEANATTISNPTETHIVNITTSSKLGATYPYLLTLVIMFIGMLLASMLILEEKTSRASFRNFTTPISDQYQIVVAFLTALLVLLIEVCVIMLVSSLFIPQPLHLASTSTIALVIVAIVLFTFLGMIIGYLSNTQQTAMIACISIGSIFLFVSNLIIPIEGMAKAVQLLTALNPFVVLSELLRRSMLYGVTFDQVSRQISVLIILCCVLFAATLWIHQRLKKQYFRQDDGFILHIAAPLTLGEKQIHNEVELLDVLDHLTRTEFEKIVTQEKNPIAEWVRKELHNNRLARKLNTTSKERMIITLDKHLRHHGRKLK